ncbi:hypothetical protein A2Z33_06645 [Candidatus Gottesmanbacteria bacterium RBG_16_52_11]|uniref:Type 4 fimbrial biogenesis protein PilX N-terminal domain-containing protein n=1 Tax=Candidatus Gottesmanbacteria bacterium RBG_16_52_11 TaxID=1798374 RepID=A0A1F5YXY3_9BACT|nr:MAG: hypothetical protein A2Z33_06645 [Candidatus Gottesmanbacteria bacterium RBG_16_52_11]
MIRYRNSAAHSDFGGISIFILLFGVITTSLIAGLVIIAASQYTQSLRTESYEKALSIAESGIDYYRWHLAHNPTDYTDGTGQPGPYLHEVTEPSGHADGTFSLEITPPASGSGIITIESAGWTNDRSDIKRTVRVKLGTPSIAKFAFLNNANMWFGQKTTISGKIFSNGGIRMDGTHDSSVQSARETYTCGQETGCDPPESKPGIWGEGGPQELWEFPVTSVDFEGINLDYSVMKNSAENGGLYLPASGSFGYHIVFDANGTYTVMTVTAADSERGWSVENGCETLYQVIDEETPVGTYTISTKPIIFAEDHLWVEGTVNGKVTVVAARFPLDLNDMNIWINNNIVYVAKDGSHNLGLIAQNNIYIPLDVPEILEIDAALLAHENKVLRHDYKHKDCKNAPGAVRQKLIFYGALISNQRSYWNYGGGSAGFGSDPVSGFSQREFTYDPYLYYSPPPYFPLQGGIEIISWEEE